ncbi:NADH:flavin oxidoreductase/NADH oxidase [Alicyclobacillus acidoterrestris]|uniref:NADH:flavin oxidoreductase/NADH oxidase n=1 Tax=Alicyclobacillus acidoterrestris (strain ATCC 49025 / DSM 3922 / CIP 106132 / NCIMB 13137 / GD3B) TaxID=1356854 RepID=T0CVR6_ALIAG|nr:NADH:flavin oxidoreductase/NADH oxidase [Alicyclobacillus acidoterrestris]EPZ43487.1 NADPH dehydrogenase [Alicyclobacillus acidoterrestris ATCC 49025]UNO50173.1 NADH:flavin oxidoreductase/NADH oxidase [Alicyclobacillus acidoterrestris]
MARLFTPFSLKDLTLKNRIVMAPMCQYSVTAKDGVPNEWHYVHYTSRAIGGVGLIIMEMTDVEPDGRITDYDLGLWSDDHIPAFQRIIDSVHQYDAKIGIQIAHAGRKAEDAPEPVAPSAIRFEGDNYKTPRELTTDEVKRMVEKFAAAARRAVKAGVDTIEIHGAHGYLVHQFQSSLTNHRKDEYGADLTRFGVEVIEAMKAEMPSSMPLLFRLSAVEYVDGGYDIDHAIELCRAYHRAGVDMFHVSSGGEGPAGKRRPGNYPGYQVPFARAIKEQLGVPVIAVGMLDNAALAESVIANEDADLVAIARGLLNDPYFPLHAAQQLRVKPLAPKQYEMAIR